VLSEKPEGASTGYLQSHNWFELQYQPLFGGEVRQQVPPKKMTRKV